MSIIFIGGFGASTYYSQKMCLKLQQYTSRKVYNISLTHGLTLAEEVKAVLEVIHDKDSTYILMGFSTGCLVAMTLSKILRTEKLILVNPAEVLTRLNLNLLDSIVPDQDNDRNVYTFKPILKRTGLSVLSWKVIIFLFEWIWFIAMIFIGSKKLSELYYHYQARHVNEPRADEFELCLFKPGRRFKELIITLVECILKPSLIDLIRKTNRRIYIVQGNKDFLYIPYVTLIYNSFLHVTLHRTTGDHHMIYHHPIETAQRISTIIK